MCIFNNKKWYLLFMLIASQFAFATTIQKFSFTELIELSESIIEGEIVKVSSITEEGLIYTRVILKVDDVLKGSNLGEFIELDFLGGSTGEKSLVLAGQDVPQEGERGFYFLEDLSIKAINPILGWSQGQFRIITDAKGNEVLATEIGSVRQELVELKENKNTALAAKLNRMKFSRELVEQVYYTPKTPDELRDEVQTILNGKN